MGSKKNKKIIEIIVGMCTRKKNRSEEVQVFKTNTYEVLTPFSSHWSAKGLQNNKFEQVTRV